MASTYSPNLRLELIGTGEQQGTWGATTNTNLGTLIEEAIGGYVSVTVSDAGDTTLTTNNGSADQARNAVINLTGTISQARNVLCPAIEKVYIVRNATTGGFAVTFKVSGQTGVSIPNGSTYLVYVNGTDAVAVTGSIASQPASNVSITGGAISGLSNLSVANATVATTVRGNLGAAASGTNTDITSIYLNNTGLKLKDTNASHGLIIAPGSDLSADRTLTMTTGDAPRTLTISGDATVSQDYSTTGNPQFATIELGAASDTTLSRVSAGVAAVEGKTIALNGTTETLTTGTIELGAATDTTLSRSAAGVLAVEGNLVPSPASQAHGDILFRGASAWQRLAAGTSGQFLRTAGAGADPTWAAASGGMTLLGTLTTNTGATTYVLGSLNLTSYRALYFQIAGTSAGSGGMSWRFESTTGAQFAIASTTAAQTISGYTWIDLQVGNFISLTALSTSTANTSALITGTAPTGQAVYYGRAPYTTATTTITISADSGGANPDAGTIRIYGVS